MQVTTRVFDLPLRHPFTISRGTVRVQRTWIVELEEDGLVGRGEATVNPYYNATVEGMEKALGAVMEDLVLGKLEHPAEWWQRLDDRLKHYRFAQSAIDCALWDLWGQRFGQPTWKAMGIDSCHGPMSCYTIGIDTPEMMVEKLRQMPGWPVYKVKVGTPSDQEVLALLRRETDRPFRVDANCGWSPGKVRETIEGLLPMGVELVEQPVAPDLADCLAQIKVDSPLPLMADESCEEESDVDRCADRFHAINIKLVKCGGLTPGLRMARRAKELGLRVMVGCMTESSVGISAAAQLLGLLDFADLDGAVLLAEDIAKGVQVDFGRVVFPDKPGLGIEILPCDSI
ncbi:MAG: dipeptide epimerase [Pirellulaceae bacterium]